MKTFESNKILIKRPAKEIFDFLSDFRNFEKLMPEEITNWRADESSCSFTIKNMADLNMAFGERQANEKITMISRGKNPFVYDLNVFMDENGEGTQTQIVFNADLNPMLSMMVSNPLKNFINILNEKLKEVMEQ